MCMCVFSVVGDLRAALSKLESRVSSREKTPKSEAAVPCAKVRQTQTDRLYQWFPTLVLREHLSCMF